MKLINNTLSLHGFSIQDFGLPDIFNELMEYNDDIDDDISSRGTKKSQFRSYRRRNAKNAPKTKKSQQTVFREKNPVCALPDEEKPVCAVLG